MPEPGHPVRNEPFRRWGETTFVVDIPATALEVVPNPAEMGDADTSDDWCRWVNAHA